MTDRPEAPERLSLSRWSRRKLAASAEPANAPAASVGTAPVAPAQSAAATGSASAQLPTQLPNELPTQLPTPANLPTQLPDISSLGFDSDFTAFLRPEVDEKLKRAALKQLFRDPRFNVMDGLDTYIDDYTKADPIEPGVLAEMLKRFGATVETGQEQPAVANVADAAPATDGRAATENADNDLSSAHLPEPGHAPPGEGGAEGDAAVARDGTADDQHGGR